MGLLPDVYPPTGDGHPPDDGLGAPPARRPDTCFPACVRPHEANHALHVLHRFSAAQDNPAGVRLLNQSGHRQWRKGQRDSEKQVELHYAISLLSEVLIISCQYRFVPLHSFATGSNNKLTCLITAIKAVE